MGSEEVRDPIHGLIKLYPEEWSVVNCRPFQRLRGIQQLAMTHLVYPGARHSRFEHSVGAAHVAGRLASRIGLPENDPKARRIRMAALVHDLGHGPFSHVSDEIFEKRTDWKSGHEKISAAITRHDPGMRAAMGDETSDWVADLLAEKDFGAKRSFERDVVSGSADADKMDYLLRDSHYCGVKYGQYDLDKIIETARVVEASLGSEVFLGFDKQGVFTLEELLLARYHMHRQVYGHKTRVATDRMLVHAMEAAIDDGLLPADVFTPPTEPDGDFVKEYLKLDDSSVIQTLLANPSSRAGELMTALMERRLFKRIIEYDFVKLEAEFGQPAAGYIARPSDKRILRDRLGEAEAIVAEAIGVAPHLVSLYWKELISPISRPFSFNVSGKGIFITDGDRPEQPAREFNQVSQVFQQEELSAEMRITLYASLPNDETVKTLSVERWQVIAEGMSAALALIGEASSGS